MIIMKYIEYLNQRHSVYALSNEEVIPDDDITKLVGSVIEATPSAFNSQTQRVMILFGPRHLEFWKILMNELQNIVPPESFPRTEAKINGFAAARGTILFFDSLDETEKLMEQFPLYKKNFALWSQQQNGMLQENVWVALATEGIGASLQHYNEIVKGKIEAAFGIPSGWDIIAQMPFGKIMEKPEAKPKLKLETRLIVRK